MHTLHLSLLLLGILMLGATTGVPAATSALARRSPRRWRRRWNAGGAHGL